MAKDHTGIERVSVPLEADTPNQLYPAASLGIVIKIMLPKCMIA